MMNSRRLLLLLLPSLIIGLLLVWIRFQLIEPAAMRARCELDQSGLCQIRQAVIELFVHQRIGWAALVAAAIAVLTRRLWAAAVGLLMATASLILYVPEPGALAFLVSLLVMVRALRDGRQLNAPATQTAAKPSA